MALEPMVYFILGLLTGGIGTLVGAGGGFLLAPVFIFMFPEMSAARLTALSLLAVAANSASGSIGYGIRKQVHWRSVMLFSLAAIPGVLFGVFISHIAPRPAFELLFAVFLFVMSIYVLWRSFRPSRASESGSDFWNTTSRIYGSIISFFVGILSSLLGIGGGIVHVPLLSEVLRYPVHLAAGTSHAILAITSAVAVADHYWHGDLNNLDAFVPYLVVGLICGAQGGAALSKKVTSYWILRILGLALLLVAIRLVFKNIA